jgi:hypothetical protein
MEDIVEHNYNVFMNKLSKRPEQFLELEKYSNENFQIPKLKLL